MTSFTPNMTNAIPFNLLRDVILSKNTINEYGERLKTIDSKSPTKKEIADKLAELKENVEHNTNNNNGRGVPGISINFDNISNILFEMKINSYPTGSKVFGLDTKESDFDIVILKPSDKIMADIKNKLFHQFGTYVDVASNYNDGIKCHFAFHEGKIINLIPLSRHDYFYWMVTTDIIKDLCRLSPASMKIKATRVGMFETITGLVRMTYGNEISYDTISNYITTKNKEVSKIINDTLYGKSKGVEKIKLRQWIKVIDPD